MALTFLLRFHLSTEEDLQRRERAVRGRLDSLRLVLKRLVPALQQVNYPFGDPPDVISLAAFVSADLPPDDNEMSAFERAGLVLSRLYDFFARTARRLSVIVEGVER
jgi:hypothetical protein